MTKTCKDCAHCRPDERRWWGNHYGIGCAAEEDGIHELSWGRQIYRPDGEPERTEKGLLKVSSCYYWTSKEEFEQIEMFE